MKPRHLLSLIVLGAAVAALAAPAHAQRDRQRAAAAALDFDLPELQALAERADAVVEITLDRELLALAAGFVAADEPEDPDLQRLVGQLQGVFVRVFEFSAPGAYDPAIVERLRSRLGPGWTPVVNVREKGGEHVEILVDREPGGLRGLVLLAAEPQELAIVHLAGAVDLATLSRLEGSLGIPHVGAEQRARAAEEPR